jgi:hypothetical protein
MNLQTDQFYLYEIVKNLQTDQFYLYEIVKNLQTDQLNFHEVLRDELINRSVHSMQDSEK